MTSMSMTYIVFAELKILIGLNQTMNIYVKCNLFRKIMID